MTYPSTCSGIGTRWRYLRQAAAFGVVWNPHYVNSSGKLIVQPPTSCPLASTSKANQMDVYQAYFQMFASLAFPSGYEFTNGGPKHFVAGFPHSRLNVRRTVTL